MSTVRASVRLHSRSNLALTHSIARVRTVSCVTSLGAISNRVLTVARSVNMVMPDSEVYLANCRELLRSRPLYPGSHGRGHHHRHRIRRRVIEVDFLDEPHRQLVVCKPNVLGGI